MSDITVRIASLALASLFAWSAAAKLLRYDAWRIALAGYALPRPMELGARALVPLTELALAAAIVLGAVRLGAAASLALLAAFSIAILRARSIQGDKLPCGCFGRTKKRDYRWSLARNAGLALVAALTLARGEDVSPLDGFAVPSGSEVVAFGLVLVGAGLVVWMLLNVLRIGNSGAQSTASEGVVRK